MSGLNLFLTAIQGIAPLLLVVILLTTFYKKEKFSFKAVGVGVLVFIVFSQILEKLLHLYVLQQNPSTSAYLSAHAAAYALYGALAAGLFEELGRYFGFRVLLRKYHSWKDGIAYGLGHGGFEVLLIGTLTSLNFIIFGVLLNQGQFSALAAKLPAAQVSQILAQIHQPSSMYVAGIGIVLLERAVGLTVQLALSLIVLLSARNRKIAYLLLAILLHALVDFVPALYQMHAVHMLVAECYLIVMGAIALFFLLRSPRLFERNERAVTAD